MMIRIRNMLFYNNLSYNIINLIRFLYKIQSFRIVALQIFIGLNKQKLINVYSVKMNCNRIKIIFFKCMDCFKFKKSNKGKWKLKIANLLIMLYLDNS